MNVEEGTTPSSEEQTDPSLASTKTNEGEEQDPNPPGNEGDDPKPGAEKEEPGKPEAPEPLTAEALEFPEGVEVDDASRDKFLEILNDSKLSPTDRANALINLQKDVMEAALEAGSDAWNNTQEEWKAEAKADEEIGGAKLQPTLTNVAKLIDEYGSDELRGVFNLTGAGNSVHVIKFLSKIAERLIESTPNPGVPGEQGQTSAAQRMYPSMKG